MIPYSGTKIINHLGIGTIVASAYFHLCLAGIISQNCVDVRSFSLAHNTNSLSKDVSSLFWNPAGLAFLPSHKFTISMSGLRNSFTPDLLNSAHSLQYNNLQLVNVGEANKIHDPSDPQENIGIAFGYHSPYTFIDHNNLTTKTLSKNSMTIQENEFRTTGSLHFWSFGSGIMLAERASIGVSMSLITGNEKSATSVTRTIQTTDGISDREIVLLHAIKTYKGYDLRVGALYSPTKRIDIGFLLVVPGYIRFLEHTTATLPLLDSSYSLSKSGSLESSYSGSIAMSFPLDIATMTLQLKFRRPYDDKSDPILARIWKLGAGISLTVPLPTLPLILRTGYSIDAYDPHTFIITYDKEIPRPIVDNRGNTTQLLAVGIEYCLSPAVQIAVAYGYSLWKVSPQAITFDTYQSHKLITGIELSY